ncbi:hypothetical protein [Hippea sp. KM1]|uniref:hypothetical protein n=1 Tax=Hippea sp. KM1 TaxID=944481 RepID=UPI00046D3A19|nr:hypothetical protein [Hippea sp. KM1]
MSDRLDFYLKEAGIHIERLEDVLGRLKNVYPLDINRFENLNSYEKDMLDTLAFRFAKLQDLIGSRIFREFLKEMGYIVEEKTFFDILKEIEKEGIIDIDSWNEFRKVRNFLSHEYPYSFEDRIEAINYLIEKTPELIEVIKKIEDKVERGRD